MAYCRFSRPNESSLLFVTVLLVLSGLLVVTLVPSAPPTLEINETTSKALIEPTPQLEDRPEVAQGLTVVMTTYRRPAMVTALVQKLRTYELVKDIIVIWNAVEETDIPNELTLHARVIVPAKNSLNNKFISPIPHVRTDGVLLIDDDLVISESSAAMLYSYWSRNQNAMVGPLAVLRDYEWDARRKRARYIYGRILKKNRETAQFQFSMILTGVAMLHRRYLEAYALRAPAHLLALVDAKQSCEDLLMNFIVALDNQVTGTKHQLIGLRGIPVDNGERGSGEFVGLSQLHSIGLRDYCLTHFLRHFGPELLQQRSFETQWIEESAPTTAAAAAAAAVGGGGQ